MRHISAVIPLLAAVGSAIGAIGLAAPSHAQDAPAAVESAPAETPRYVLDAMVGQVNGKPVYAETVLSPMHEELKRLGATLPRSVFQQRARDLIVRRMQEIVFDALMLGEAERNLTEREQMGLKFELNRREQELLRRYGQKSRTLADANAVQATGQTVAQLLEEGRQKLVVQHYMRQKIDPRVHVTAKDVERYYNAHPEIYNPPAGRRLRLIRCADEATAQQVTVLLEEGMPFEEAAALEFNQYKRTAGGLFPPESSRGDMVFSNMPAVNDAMLKLKAGEHSPFIAAEGAYWCVFVESISDGRSRPIGEVQDEIYELLRRQQFNVLSMRYQQELFNEGSYNSLPEMSAAVLSVAMSRYAMPE